jgi:hypothetical protein
MVIFGKNPIFDGFWVIFQPITTMTRYSHRVDPLVILDDPPIFVVGEPEKTPKTSIIPIPDVKFHDTSA